MAKEDATKNATLGFEAELWKAAEKVWGHIPAAEYRQILLFGQGSRFSCLCNQAYEWQ